MSKNGIVLIDKKAGISSVYAEKDMKRLFGTKKVGHAGTLDPFATGLIICGIEKGTKALPFFEDKDKTYEALLQLGFKTETGDKDGLIVSQKPAVHHSESEIKTALDSFLGDSMQIPPMFSALKKDGVPLYKLAREHQEVEREPRKIHVYAIKLLDYNMTEGTISFSVTVSKGTYIRVIGEDLAQKLNELGYLKALRRTKVGAFDVKDAHLPENIVPERDLIEIKDLFPHLERHILSSEEEKRLRNGADLEIASEEPLLLLLSSNGEALAIYQKADKGFYKVFKEFI